MIAQVAEDETNEVKDPGSNPFSVENPLKLWRWLWESARPSLLSHGFHVPVVFGSLISSPIEWKDTDVVVDLYEVIKSRFHVFKFCVAL